MQAQDQFSVPRRTLDIEDYVDIARRHRTWIFGPLFASIVASVVGAFLWPNTYTSKATIKVQPQQVPESFVPSSVNQQLQERIASMTTNVLSRANLTTIIQTYDLYPRERSRLPIEDVFEAMKKDIVISNVVNYGAGGGRGLAAFQIEFSYTDRFKAAKVVSDLTSKFIDTSIRERTTSTNLTNQVLKDEWEAAKKEIERIDVQIAEFKAKNPGRTPDEVPVNLQQMNTLQTQLTNLNASISRVSQEKVMYETQLRILKDQMNSIKDPAALEQTMPLMKSEKVIDAEREVANVERQLSVLREHYKDTYPGVQTTLSMLASAKKKLEDARKEDAARKPEVIRQQANPNSAREQRELEASYKRVQAQIEAKDIEAEEYRKQLATVNNQIRLAQSRMEGVPYSEKQYMELMRDRGLANQRYIDLDQKVSKSEMSDNIERRKLGESLEVLDSASIPQTPVKPKREMIIGAGAAVGLMIGLAFAGIREMKDTSLKNLKDVRAYTQLPILGSIPLLENDLVVRRRKRMAWLGWSFAVLVGVVLMAGSVVYYFATKA